MPNGGTFTTGCESAIVATGVVVSVLFVGGTTRVLGATPKLHCRRAPMQTC
jgi:hypothetical protein